MIKLMARAIWQVIDALCFLTAMVFIVWGLFLINLAAGLIGIGIALIIVGWGTELISQQQGGER